MSRKEPFELDVRTPGRLYTAQTASESQLPSKHTPFAAGHLLPSLWNSYTRLTFLNKRAKERVTVDIDLQFQWEGRQLHFPGLVVAEVKQENRNLHSPFIQLLRDQHIRSTGFSKYCIGVSLLYPEVKSNNFKTKHRLVARLLQGDNRDSH